MARQLNGSSNGASHLVDEDNLRALVLKWQSDQGVEMLEEILRHCEPIVRGVTFSRYGCVEDQDEVLNQLRCRIWRKLSTYDPCRGRVDQYVRMAVRQGLAEQMLCRARHKERYQTADISTLDFLEFASGKSCDGIFRAEIFEDVLHRIGQVRTRCTDEHELEAQRWLVRGFIDSEFKLRRHQAADALIIGYGIDYSRSRRLHDATLLEVRRQLLALMEIPEIEVIDLRGTRAIALAKYASQLSSEDFSKLVYLMRNLAPIIIEEGRIDWVLNGYPDARLLFA